MTVCFQKRQSRRSCEINFHFLDKQQIDKNGMKKLRRLYTTNKAVMH